ncbi:MAG: S8 family serine peptidase, partial [Bacteroidales bacterium]|nr:S8 family serine peptidase [Bacteroidales bacterium]
MSASKSYAQEEYRIKLKSRKFIPSSEITSTIQNKITTFQSEKMHIILQFHELPDESIKAQLRQKGVNLLSYIPNNAWFASIPQGLSMNDPEFSSVRWIGEVLPEDKLSSSVASKKFYKRALNIDGTIKLSVTFYSDVQTQEANNVLSNYTSIISGPDMSNTYAIALPEDKIMNLASEDIIQWINQVSPPDREHNDGARAATSVDIVQAIPYNLNGTNVDVGIWDGGAIDSLHDDIEGRVTVVESDPTGDHATHVAGILGGDGTLSESEGGSALQWRGMATNVDFISYSYLNDDLEPEEHDEAINTYGIDLSQNSWGLALSFDDALYGDYNSRASRYDNVVRGVFGRAIPIIFSVGNDQDNVTGSYGSITPPGGTAKNTITVGAINSNDDSMTGFSSWGPTDDGRIKPDIVAPGCQSTDDGGITSTIPDGLFVDDYSWLDCDGTGDDYCYPYDVMCGTSMAAPVVSGIVSLMIEEFRNQNGTDPLPSTIKAILINTAEDLGNPGPDYANGFGKVNAKNAVDAIILGSFDEGRFNGPNGVEQYSFYVQPGATKFQISLAWDDFPGTVNADPALVNQLDLILYDPSNNEFRPWGLDPAIPGANAITDRDEINNIEQITISNPESGTWTVYVLGANIPEFPQTYSLAWEYTPTGGPTNVKGTISTDTTWTNENSPYVITGDVTINAGTT